MYGTGNGILGFFTANNSDISRGWTFESEESQGGIQCLTACDLTGDGVNDVVIGRDDGLGSDTID